MMKAYAVTFGGGSLALLGLLTMIFILLKAIGVITWAWVWILSPLWIPMALSSAVALGIVCFLMVIAICVFFFGRKDEAI